MTDKLDQIFKLQRELNDRIGLPLFSAMNEDIRIGWVLRFSRAMGQELAELVDSTPWKWWAKYQKFDIDNARIEVVDMLHFLVSLAQVLGLTADDLFDLYAKKHKVNQKRQDSGYSRKTKDDKHVKIGRKK